MNKQKKKKKSYDPYSPPKPPDYIILFLDNSASRQLPPFPELEMNVLGESSQLTDITSVMERSLRDLAASALSFNRRNIVWHPVNGEEVHTEDEIMRWRCKRCKPFVAGVNV